MAGFLLRRVPNYFHEQVASFLQGSVASKKTLFNLVWFISGPQSPVVNEGTSISAESLLLWYPIQPGGSTDNSKFLGHRNYLTPGCPLGRKYLPDHGPSKINLRASTLVTVKVILVWDNQRLLPLHPSFGDFGYRRTLASRAYSPSTHYSTSITAHWGPAPTLLTGAVVQQMKRYNTSYINVRYQG